MTSRLFISWIVKMTHFGDKGLRIYSRIQYGVLAVLIFCGVTACKDTTAPAKHFELVTFNGTPLPTIWVLAPTGGFYYLQSGRIDRINTNGTCRYTLMIGPIAPGQYATEVDTEPCVRNGDEIIVTGVPLLTTEVVTLRFVKRQ